MDGPGGDEADDIVLGERLEVLLLHGILDGTGRTSILDLADPDSQATLLLTNTTWLVNLHESTLRGV